MKNNLRKKITFVATLFAIFVFSTAFPKSLKKDMDNVKFQPMVVNQFFEKAKNNKNWKLAFATAEQAQIVFMNISPQTNPENEIGSEVHPFDQVILIVEGNAKAVLNGKKSRIKSGDMLFIPKGTQHNVINLNKRKELKVISFYSENDIPNTAVYQKKADESKT